VEECQPLALGEKVFENGRPRHTDPGPIAHSLDISKLGGAGGLGMTFNGTAVQVELFVFIFVL
jgi:hypothetical protein